MRNVVYGERQVGGVAGDSPGNIREASLGAVHLHHAPVVDDIARQGLGV